MIKCGVFYTAALTDAGEVIVWGSNLNGQHGNSPEFTSNPANKIKNIKLLSDNLE